MWKQVLDLFRLFFSMSEELRRVQADLKDHSQQIRTLADNQTRLHFEFQLWKEREARERERESHEREREAMQRELLRLRDQIERLQLPPAPPDKKSDEQ